MECAFSKKLMCCRLVELGKLKIQTEERERKVNDSDYIRKMKNRAGVLETRLISCVECGEEFCSGELCTDFMYESSLRENKALSGPAADKTNSPERGRTKTRRPRRSKSRRKSGKTKSKSRFVIIDVNHIQRTGHQLTCCVTYVVVV